METWDNAQPDRDRIIGGGSGVPDAVSGAVPESQLEVGAEAELHRMLRSVADGIVAVPDGMYPKVMARATRIRRRRRAVRAGSATAVLVMAAVLGPSVASQLGVRGGDASAAPPPSAIVDLTSAYPVQDVQVGGQAEATPTTEPGNALAWPSRGVAVPAQAVAVAKSYLLGHAGAGGSAASATVTSLWAQVDGASGSGSSAHKTWLYVMQGWTVASDGAPSKAELLVGDYTVTVSKGAGAGAASMSVYAMPVVFAHVRPGTADDADDTRQIAELSVWLPQSGRLVVLGAPQTRAVFYTAVGKELVEQKTVDGVAVFPRTRRLVKGRYADGIQVRDANNVALTPPGVWGAADFSLTGAGSLWSGDGAEGSDVSDGGWVKLPARGGGREEMTGPEPVAGQESAGQESAAGLASTAGPQPTAWPEPVAGTEQAAGAEPTASR